MTESKISQLKKDFTSRLSLGSELKGQNDLERTTVSILTDEEFAELQNMWVQLSIWKQANRSA